MNDYERAAQWDPVMAGLVDEQKAIRAHLRMVAVAISRGGWSEDAHEALWNEAEHLHWELDGANQEVHGRFVQEHIDRKLPGRRVTDRRLAKFNTWYYKYEPNRRDPDNETWMVFVNDHVVSYTQARAPYGKHKGRWYDCTMVNGTIVAWMWWDECETDEDNVRASTAFQIATGWYPHEVDTLIEELRARGFNCGGDGVDAFE